MIWMGRASDTGGRGMIRVGRGSVERVEATLRVGRSSVAQIPLSHSILPHPRFRVMD